MRLAESVTDWPIVMLVNEREVVTIGLAFATISGSQVDVAALLLASPL